MSPLRALALDGAALRKLTTKVITPVNRLSLDLRILVDRMSSMA